MALGIRAISERALSELPATSSTDVTIALTGQSVTVNKGTVGVTNDSTVALTGQALTIAQGTILPKTDVPLTGQSVTVAKGTTLPTTDIAATGQGIVVAKGSVLPTTDVPLTGQEVVIGRGDVTPSTSTDVTVAITGFSLTVNQGTLTAVNVSTDATITGGGKTYRAYIKKQETEEQKRLRREAQGIIERIKTAEPAQAETLQEDAVAISAQLKDQIARLEVRALEYQTALNVKAQTKAIADRQQFEAMLIDAQLWIETYRQQQEELDVVWVMCMIAADECN